MWNVVRNTLFESHSEVNCHSVKSMLRNSCVFTVILSLAYGAVIEHFSDELENSEPDQWIGGPLEPACPKFKYPIVIAPNSLGR